MKFKKHLEFSSEVSFFTGSYSVYSKFKTKTKKAKKTFFAAPNTIWKIVSFFGHFFGNRDNIGDRQFLGDLLSYSKRVILLLPRLQVSYGVLGNFFSTNWPWSQKTNRGMRDNPLSPSWKTLLYYETYATSQKAISWPISFLFFVRSESSTSNLFSSKSCSCIVLGAQRNFFAEKTNHKNVAILRTCSRETGCCKKLIFYLKKALPMLRKMPKTALF